MNRMDYIIYQNLFEEIRKRNRSITLKEMARRMEMPRHTLKKKLSGKASFNLDEAFRMQRTFFPGEDIRYLFQELTTE